jgi:hypothetical protein
MGRRDNRPLLFVLGAVAFILAAITSVIAVWIAFQ